MSLGPTELIVLLVIALLLFGPTRLPGLGKSLGEAIRGFKKGIDGGDEKPATPPREQIVAPSAEASTVTEKEKETSKQS